MQLLRQGKHAGGRLVQAQVYRYLYPFRPIIDTRHYPYTDQLLALESCSQNRTNPHQLPQEWCEVITPMHIDFWRTELATY